MTDVLRKIPIRYFVIIILSIFLLFEVITIFPKYLIKIDFKEYVLNTQSKEIVIGSDPMCDISLVGNKIDAKHLRITFQDSIPYFQNISENKKVDINDVYISSKKLVKGDIIEIRGNKYTLLKVPQLHLLGMRLTLLNKNGKKKTISSLISRIVYPEKELNIIDEKYQKKMCYIKLEFANNKIRTIYDISIILIFLSLLLLILFYIQQFMVSIKLSLNLIISKRIQIISLITALLGLLGYFLSMQYTESYLKLTNFNREVKESIKINNVALTDQIKSIPYNSEAQYSKSEQWHHLIIGYTHFKMFVQEHSNGRLIILRPINNYIFIKSNYFVQELRLTHVNSSDNNNLTLLFPKNFQSESTSLNSVITLKNLKDDMLKLSIYHVNKYQKLYLLMIFIYLIINIIFIIIFSKQYESLYFSVFTFILLQGILLMHQLSLFSNRHYFLYERYLNNVIIGCYAFFLYFFITQVLLFVTQYFKDYRYCLINPFSVTKRSLRNYDMWILFVLNIIGFLSFVVFFLEKKILLGLISGLPILLISMHIVSHNLKLKTINIVSYKGMISRYFLTERFGRKEFSILMIGIFFFLILQTLTGGEQGLYFLGTNYQLFEGFKVILTIIIIAQYYLYYNSSSNFYFQNWIIPLPTLFILIFFVHDFSPFILFSFLFLLNILLHYEKHKFSWFFILCFFLFWIFIANSYWILFLLLSMILIIVIIYSNMSKFKNMKSLLKFNKTVFYTIVFTIMTIIICLTFLEIPEEFYRLFDWQNHWNSHNHQFLQSFFYIQSSAIESIDIYNVPAIKDDMIFSLYFNRFGIWGILGLILSIAIILGKAISFRLGYIKNEKRWIPDQILFITFLFIFQMFIALSNVTGFLPIMGQPFPGLSYSASNLIFFFFGIFFLLLELDREYKILDNKD